MANTKYAVNRNQSADRRADKHWARLLAKKKTLKQTPGRSGVACEHTTVGDTSKTNA